MQEIYKCKLKDAESYIKDIVTKINVSILIPTFNNLNYLKLCINNKKILNLIIK